MKKVITFKLHPASEGLFLKDLRFSKNDFPGDDSYAWQFCDMGCLKDVFVSKV